MIAEICEKLQEQTEIRGNLILLKEQIKKTDCKNELLQWERRHGFLQSFLQNEDAKVRKNAALILGLLEAGDSAPALYEAYESEDKLFVKSAYLTALSSMDCSRYADRLRGRYQHLLEYACPEEEKKHIQEEIRALEKLLQKLDGVKRHRFTGYDEEAEVILTTNPLWREVTAGQIKNGECVLVPGGVKVKTKDIRELLEIRTFRELLFLTGSSRHIGDVPEQIAEELLSGGLLEQLQSLHEGEPPFYFRIELRRGPKEDTGSFIRRLAACLEEKSGRRLINSTDRYEVELRLNWNRDGTIFPAVRLFTIPMRRFAYRKKSVAASMHPVTASLLMRLAEPYLKKGAQVLDPFCGVGTLLIERDLLVQAGDMYGTDIFGEAVAGARENAKAAGMNINYINRDIFDFTHQYLFDEIVADMPLRGKKTKEEQDRFYGRFLEKASELLKRGGVIVMYSNENGFVKKHLRLRDDFYLKKEYCIREKDGYYLFIIGFKR